MTAAEWACEIEESECEQETCGLTCYSFDGAGMRREAERVIALAVAEARAEVRDEVFAEIERLGKEILSDNPGLAHDGGALTLALLGERIRKHLSEPPTKPLPKEESNG